jgi:hypothetical protein
MIHACPENLVDQVNQVLLSFELSVTWLQQELMLGNKQAELAIKISEEQVEELASALYAVGEIYFEINQRQGKFGLLFMGVPGLGVYRGELNEAGSILLSEDRINQMISQGAGNQREFMRLLRVALGQSWDDIIEPFRAARYSDNVVLLNRAG